MAVVAAWANSAAHETRPDAHLDVVSPPPPMHPHPTTSTGPLPEFRVRRALLDAVGSWEANIGAGTVAPQLKARAALGVSRAAAPLSVIGQATDPQLVAEVQELRSENAVLTDRFQKLQMQCTSILGE